MCCALLGATLNKERGTLNKEQNKDTKGTSQSTISAMQSGLYIVFSHQIVKKCMEHIAYNQNYQYVISQEVNKETFFDQSNQI